MVVDGQRHASTALPPGKKLVRCQLKCDGTRAETRFRLSAKRTSPFKAAEASVQSTTGSRGVHISGNNAGYTMFRGSVKGTGYPLHSPVCPSFPLPCVTVCHHISTGVYHFTGCRMGFRAGLDGCGNSRLHLVSILVSSSPLASLYTEYAVPANCQCLCTTIWFIFPTL
jgi:hypothetical protein